MRPLWLTMVLCVVMLAGAADLAFGSRVIGFVALMGAAGILTVIMSTCETYISILDSLIPLIILFFAGGYAALDSGTWRCCDCMCAGPFGPYQGKNSQNDRSHHHNGYAFGLCLGVCGGSFMFWTAMR